MATTRTPGITIGADGRFLIDKRHRGIRIFVRMDATTQEQAEQRLQTEMQHVDVACRAKAKARPCLYRGLVRRSSRIKTQVSSPSSNRRGAASGRASATWHAPMPQPSRISAST
jgi:hypothetical protein